MNLKIDIPVVAPVLLILSLPLLLTMHLVAWAFVGLLFLFNLFGILVTLFRLLFIGLGEGYAAEPVWQDPTASTGIKRLAQAERDIRSHAGN